MSRVERLRERMIQAEHGRHRMVLPQEWSTSHLACSLPERKALAMDMIVERMPIFIGDDELIVGGRTVFGLKDPAKPLTDPSNDLVRFVYPSYYTVEERESSPIREGHSKGHYVAGYRRVLELGYAGIIEEAWDRLQEAQEPAERDFLRSVTIVYASASRLAMRYSKLAAEMAAQATEPRRGELEEIARVCRHVAAQAPTNLHEALQICWFTHLMLMIENHSLMNFGRFDQYMAPFYDTTPPAEAQELLECFFIKANDQNDIQQGGGNSGDNNVVLGGLRPDGSDATNPLTYACLDVLDHLRLATPQFNMRLHKNSPQRLVTRACDLARQGLGQLAFYNDDVIIPSLEGAGFPAEHARDWALDACQDILIEGRSDFYLGGAVRLTELLLEMVDALDEDMSWDELLGAYKACVAGAVRTQAENYIRSLSQPAMSPLPFLSATLDHCLASAKDVTAGGLQYRDKGIFVMSPVNAANSLAAIKSVVYEQGAATLAEVREACRCNYQGYEPLRQQLLTAPKWGNDDDAVDLLAKDVFEFACREIQEYRIDDEARFLSGIHQPHHVMAGARLGATPDGRRAGEPIPVTLTPANGTDRKGPTAVINSVTKLDPMLCQWNSALMLGFTPSILAGDDGLQKYEGLLRTFMSLGGIELQTNVVDIAKLRAAQRDPASYRSLVVRVWGYCAYFVHLSPQYQEEFIARTQQAL